VKVRVGVCHSSVAEGNCVGPKRRGEQPEANCRSVGERTRFGGGAATSLLTQGEVRNSLDTLRVVDKAMFRQPNVVGDGTTGRCGEVSGETCAVGGERGAGVRVSIVPKR
jgi:hypothetical protein